jgi:hypothetical protein
MEKVPCSNILQKLRTFEDHQNFSRELGNINNIIFRFYTPKRKVFDVKFFLGFLRGEKKVHIILIFL